MLLLVSGVAFHFFSFSFLPIPMLCRSPSRALAFGEKDLLFAPVAGKNAVVILLWEMT